MTRIIRHLSVAALATALACAALPDLAAGATPAPVGTVTQVNAPKLTSTDTRVTPIAGTTDTSSFNAPWAVYARYNVENKSPDPTGQLLAVTSTHKTYVFGEITPDMEHFSLSGNTLAAASVRDASRVYYWQPPYGDPQKTYQTSTVATGDRYLTAAPDGLVEIDADGMLYDVDPSGDTSAKPLVNPFGTAQDVSAVSGPTGVVAWDASQIDFISYATHTITPLDTSSLPPYVSGESAINCWSASASAVACNGVSLEGDDDDDDGGFGVFLDPLDGAPSYAQGTACSDPVVEGDVAGWRTCTGRLQVIGDGTLVTSTAAIGTSVIAGLGGFLTTDLLGDTGLLISKNAKTTSTALASTKSVAETSVFALSGNSITWSQNDKGSAPVTIHRRTITRNSFHTGVTIGSSKTVGTSKVARGVITAAGSTYVYTTKYADTALHQGGGEDLRVVTPSHTTTIDGAYRYGTVEVGDHRVLYFVGNQQARLYNLQTRKTTKLVAEAAALSGPDLAYLDLEGTLRLKNLDTGAVSIVGGNIALSDPTEDLFVHGSLVAWNGYPLSGTGSSGGFYRDMSGNGPVVSLPSDQGVWALSDAGIVEEHTVIAAGSIPPDPVLVETLGLRFTGAVTFSLQPYDGGTPTTLLTGNYMFAGPQVSGNVFAWIDQHGLLQAEALE